MLRHLSYTIKMHVIYPQLTKSLVIFKLPVLFTGHSVNIHYSFHIFLS